MYKNKKTPLGAFNKGSVTYREVNIILLGQ